MKFYIILLTLFFTTTLSPVHADTNKTSYVQIKMPFVSVYKKLDPKSKIIKQVTKNTRIELVYEGTSWYQVKVDGKIGWVEKKAGIVVDNPGRTILSIPAGTFIFFLLLLIATVATSLFIIHKQKTPEAL